MRNRIVIWLLSCILISIVAFGELWPKLFDWLSTQGLQTHGVFHWGIFCLCLIWLWLKRQDILPRMRSARPNPRYIFAGFAVLALSLFLPRSEDFLLFLMLSGWLGVFITLFGRASLVPSLLLIIYGFSVGFPIVMDPLIGEGAAVANTNVVIAIFHIFGLPITHEGTVLTFTSADGDTVSTVLTTACSGYTTLGVFLALFALMMLDIRLPLKKAWIVFLFGLIGTWLQNIVRIVITITAGYYWGSAGLDSTHYNISYIIFPVWFALFAYVYLRVARRR